MRIQLLLLVCMSCSLFTMEKQDRLVQAALDNNAPLIQDLVEKEEANPNQPNQSGVFPLVAAYNCSKQDAFKKLLELKASPEAKMGDTPLLVQSVIDDNLLFFKMLLDSKPKPDSVDSLGQTALMKAAQYGRLSYMVELLPKANSSLTDNNGNTAYSLCQKSPWITSEERRAAILELFTKSPLGKKSVLKKQNPLATSV